VAVGRCYERFALQATALGIRNAFVNQPLEVPSLRSPFADAIDLTASCNAGSISAGKPAQAA
jgi:hypothetical protein